MLHRRLPEGENLKEAPGPKGPEDEYVFSLLASTNYMVF